jgi:ketosteroid isomerase-like protein
MSQENVDLVRRFFATALAMGDRESMEEAHTDFVWNPVEESASQGHAAFRACLTRWESAWDDYEATPEEFLDMGDRVVATLHFRGRGRGSGIETEARFYEVYTVRDGKIVRMDEYTTRAEALEAAGLRE